MFRFKIWHEPCLLNGVARLKKGGQFMEQSDLQTKPVKKLKKTGIISDKTREIPGRGPADPVEGEESVEIDALVEKYLPYAAALAGKMARTLPSDVDFDDVVCNARLGLLEAAQRYDGSFGVSFRTFAYYRIKGAIYDGLRKNGWIPRSLYSRIKFEQAANEYLQANARRNSNQTEFYRKQLDELHDSINSLASIYVVSLDDTDDGEVADDDAKKDIERKAEFQKIKEKVCDAIEALPDTERKLIKMYYFQNKTFEEIGGLLNLSKSWTSRLHARSLEMLFGKISGLKGEALT